MTISSAQQVDYLWKKVGYEVAKTDTSDLKDATNEPYASFPIIGGEDIWLRSDLIPNVIPAANTAQVTLYTPALSSTFQCVADVTSTLNRTWLTNAGGQRLSDWIPPSYGSTYQVKLYVAPANTANVLTQGTQLYPSGSGNNDEWFFDYQAGVLNFIGNNLPSSVAGNVVYISGARYTGYKGVGQIGYVISNVGNLTFNDTTIGTLSGSSNIVLAPGNGILSVSSTGAVQLPSGTSAQRPGAPGAGYARYNADLNTFEYFDGTEWVGYKNNIFSQLITPDGISNQFTLTAPGTSIGLIVSINGTLQQPDVAYSVTGTTITFAETPLVTDIIEVRNFAQTAGAGTLYTNQDLTMYKGVYTNLTTAPRLIDQLPLSGNTSVTYSLSLTDNVNSRYRNTEFSILASGTDTSYTEFNSIQSATGHDVATFTSNINSGNIQLWATGESSNVTVSYLRKNIGATMVTGYYNKGAPGPIGPVWTGGEANPISARVIVSNTSPSTSATTGAFQVAGGMGIAGNLFVGEQLIVNQLSFASLNNTPVGNSLPSTGAFTTLSTNGNLTVVGNIGLTGNIIPSANVTYNLGSSNYRFKDLYLSGSSIVLGGATITTSTNVITITNPQGGSLLIDTADTTSLASLSTNVSITSGNISGITNLSATSITGTSLAGTLTTAAQPNITSVGTLSSLTVGSLTVTGSGSTGNISANAITANSATINQDVLIKGNLTVQGISANIGSVDLTVNDSIINLHSPTNLDPLISNDGKDIGIKIHYYSGGDQHGFLGRTNDTGYLEWYSQGDEDVNNVFVGTKYGTFKTANLVLTENATINGKADITGNLTAGNVLGTVYGSVFGTIQTAAQTNITSVGTLNSLAVTANVVAGNLTATSGTLTVTNASIAGNISAGNIYTNGGITTGSLSTVGNITVGNVTASGVYDGGNRVVSTSTGSGNLTIVGTGIKLTQAGPGAVTVGSSTAIPVITTDIFGRIVGLTTATITTTLSTAANTGTGSVSPGVSSLGIYGTGGVLTTAVGANVNISLSSTSNGYGTRTVSASAPSGGSDGDIWYQV